MKVHLGFPALFVICAALQSNRVDAANSPAGLKCSTLKPFDTAFLTDGPRAMQDRADMLKAKGTALKAILSAAFTAAQAKKVQEEVGKLGGGAVETLKWTGHKTAVVEILFQQDLGKTKPPEFLSAGLLGTGSCAYDVVADSMSRDIIRAGPSSGYVIDNSASFYVEIGAVKGGKTGYEAKVVVPGSRGPVYSKAFGDSESKRIIKESATAREYQQLASLVGETIKIEKDQKVKQQIQEALNARQKALDSQTKIEADLKAAIDDANRIQGARAWLESLKDVLAIAQLVVQVKAMLPSSTPKSVFDQIDGATDASTLGNILGGFEQLRLNEKSVKQGDLQLLYQKIEGWRFLIIDTARKNKAPESALTLPTL